MSSTGSSEILSPSAEAFAEFLARGEAGERPDFEAFCVERPELAEGLRRLHARWREVTQVIDALGGVGEPHEGAPDSPASALLARLRARGAAAGRYEVRGEIARGGMGAVLEVWDAELRRSLAMKVLTRGRPPRFEPRALSRFLEEAQITGQLEHPGIVPIHELGIDGDGRVYFTMPLVRGESLETIIPRVHGGDPAWTLARALGVLARVCEAVGYAHARGVVHRDLKPSNVMVGAFGETYVMDWGLARVLHAPEERPARAPSGLRTVRSEPGGPDSPLATMLGDVVGTPVYMPPEQAHGRIAEMGPASDVYSIGAILYHLLAGRRPYLTDDEPSSSEGVLRAVKSRPPRPLHAIATFATTDDFELSVAVPPDPILVGEPVAAQAFSLNAGLSMTHGLVVTIGH